MARRKKRGHKKSKAIPLAMAGPALYVPIKAVQDQGFTTAALNQMLMRYTGYNAVSGTFSVDSAKAFWIGEGVGIVVHKAAGKLGVNRQLKKFTMGWLEL